MPIWRVEVPGPEISKDPAGDARIDVSSASWPAPAAEGILVVAARQSGAPNTRASQNEMPYTVGRTTPSTLT